MSAKHLVPIENLESSAPFWADVIASHSAPGDIVLVPFADDVTIAGVALERDRRVVVLVRTPAQRLRLWGQVAPPTDADCRRALAQLAGTTKRGTPLDRYLNNFYATTCPNCDDLTVATALIWDSTRKTPVEKELCCDACGFEGRAPANDADVERATQFEHHGLSFWFMLEWLADADNASEREIVRRRLRAYTPRNLTALADITRKIDAELSNDPTVHRVLRLGLLHALDAGRQLPDPEDQERNIERNIWHLLTHMPPRDDIDAPVRLTSDLEALFGGADPPPNVALKAGPIHKLARQLPAESFALILGAPPTLNADAWIWEQLWSRWVFDREAVRRLQPPVGGWPRHVRALGATMAALMTALHEDGCVFFQFEDDDPDRATATLTAMAPHTSLDEFVFQPPLVEPSGLFDAGGGVYGMTFTPASSETPVDIEPLALATAIEQAAVEAATEVLRARAEPLPHSWVLMATMSRLFRTGLLHGAMASLDSATSPLAFAKQHVRQGLRAALTEGDLAAVAGHAPTHWWLPEPPADEPLAERVEQTVVDLFHRRDSVTPADIYRRFAGYLIPETELVDALLTAYSEEVKFGTWARRPVDTGERQAMLEALRRLGERMGFVAGAGIADVVWGEGGGATHAFSVVETGQWDEIAIDDLPESVAGYLIVPDRLVDLLRVKLQRNPLWRYELAEAGWKLIKARHLTALADAEEIDRQDFKKIVGLDPIIEQAEAQMPLFEP